MVKKDDIGTTIKAALFEPLSEAIAKFSEYASKENMAEKHREMSMFLRIKAKLDDREKEKQRLKDDLKRAMGDEYEEEEDNKDDDEDSAFDEEEKEFYDRGNVFFIRKKERNQFQNVINRKRLDELLTRVHFRVNSQRTLSGKGKD